MSEASLKWHGDEVKIRSKAMITGSIYKIGLQIEAQAKQLCAVDAGYLRASINTQMAMKGTELDSAGGVSAKTGMAKGMPNGFRKITKPAQEMQALVGTAVDYAPYIEYGTVRMEYGTVRMDAQPFLRPAFDMAQGKTLTIVREDAKWYFADYLRRPV